MPQQCKICQKNFSTSSSLKRHTDAFHSESRTKFQCWSCFRNFARKETVLLHSRTQHNDTEGKFVIVSMTNTRYRPNIEKPKPWTPPPEARPRNATIYKIRIPSTNNINRTTEVRSNDLITPSKPKPDAEWKPLTIKQLREIYPISTDELLTDLELTPSSSESSIDQD